MATRFPHRRAPDGFTGLRVAGMPTAIGWPQALAWRMRRHLLDPVGGLPRSRSTVHERSAAGRRLAAGAHQPRFVGDDDRLGAVPEIELGQDRRDVRLDGGLADDELFGDLGIAHATREKSEDLGLARSQPPEGLGCDSGRESRSREALDEAARDRRREQRIADRDRPHGSRPDARARRP